MNELQKENLINTEQSNLGNKIMFSNIQMEPEQEKGMGVLKVVPYNIDITAMCSGTTCKQSCLIDNWLHRSLWSIAMHSGGQYTVKN